MNDNETEENLNLELDIDKVILNLKIVAKIKPKFKLSIKDDNLYIDNSYLNYIYRKINGDSRDKTIIFLENLDKNINLKIEEIIGRTYQSLFLNSSENILLNLSHNLNLSLVGLNNLINTYDSDELTISKIEMIISNFELKIRKISTILKIKTN
tara:strand:- start:3269 stop:3730 length:462 start_codon:yes stop_codon:yes gene_type:complete